MGNGLPELVKGPGVRFAIVGASLTILDLALYQFFANVLHVSLFSAPPAVSAVWIGTPIVITINFFVSHRFVWRSTTSKVKTIIPFFGLNLFSGVLVQSIVIAVSTSAIDAIGLYEASPDIWNFLAKCFAVGVGMVINFFGAKVLFKWDKGNG